ncbi:MAG: MBL fold metallo-hydrolase [Steroidobacteraceae bacterium]|nr:MBL fold metallo-hydrolase [Steroidobacteraceae bacterium]
MAGAASLSWPGLALARERAQPLVATRLSESLTLICGAGGNVVAARGPDGLLLVDGGSRERSRELLRLALRETRSRRVHTLINTHWHPEQTGSNEALGRSGARIIAHENTKLWLGAKITTPWDNRTYQPLPAVALPNDTLYTKAQLRWGAEQVEYGYLFQAHTDGDLYVFFRDSNVLVAGGVISSDGWPLIDWWTGGWIVGLVNGLETLLALANDTTRIVPGTGPVMSRDELRAQRDMYAEIASRLQKLLRQGKGPQEVLDAGPAREFRPEWGDQTFFLTMAFKSLWGQLTPDA